MLESKKTEANEKDYKTCIFVIGGLTECESGIQSAQKFIWKLNIRPGKR